MLTLDLKVTPQGAELVIASLRRLPHEQVHDLVMELWGQVQEQLAQQTEQTEEPSTQEAKAEGTE